MKIYLTRFFLSLSGVLKLVTIYQKFKEVIIKASKDFLKCGLLGWCLEILFTSFSAFRKRDMTLTGHTSLWMFPIYGSAFLIKPFARLLKGKSVFTRGCFYTLGIYLIEFVSGCLLMKKHACPWNYHNSRWQLHNVIRLDYVPYWFLTGLLFEFFLKKDSSAKKANT